MADILQRIGARAVTPKDAYRALTTLEGLSGWWTTDTTGNTAVGGVIKFVFETRGFFDMKVLALEPEKRVLWQVVDGPPEWIGTTVLWEIKQDGEYTIILLKHQGWAEQVEFMHHCSTKWASFVMSLKSLLETGKGTPYPVDVKIDNWN